MKKNKNTLFFRNFVFWSPPAWGRSETKNLKFSKNWPFFKKKWQIFIKISKTQFLESKMIFWLNQDSDYEIKITGRTRIPKIFVFFREKLDFSWDFNKIDKNTKSRWNTLKSPKIVKKTLKFIFLNLSYQYIQFFLRIILFFSKNHSFSIFYNSKKVTESVHLSSLWFYG